MKEPEKENQKECDIHNISNSTLLDSFVCAVCDKNYNPTTDDYNNSGYSYYELISEIFHRMQIKSD